jgi:hypothetical protein
MRIEVRTCIHCGETKEIVQKHKFATNICNQCRTKKANDYNKEKALASGRRPATTGRRPYPLRDGYKTTGPLFKAMASKTFKCKTKEEWRALMGERLENVFQNDELSYWIFAHNEDKPKKVTQIKKDYPNTKGMTWEEYERGLGDNEVDS